MLRVAEKEVKMELEPKIIFRFLEKVIPSANSLSHTVKRDKYG